MIKLLTRDSFQAAVIGSITGDCRFYLILGMYLLPFKFLFEIHCYM